MKCFVCKQDFDENDLTGVEITPQDEHGNNVGETKKSWCAMIAFSN